MKQASNVGGRYAGHVIGQVVVHKAIAAVADQNNET